MKYEELDGFLIDLCTHSVLTYPQANQLWKLLGDKHKMYRAGRDADKYGFEQAYKTATFGGYNESKTQMFYAPPCQRCRHFWPKERDGMSVEWCHAVQEQDFSCFNQ